MKYTILGFSQEAVINMSKNQTTNDKIEIIKLDVVDLTILRWIVDFYPTMAKIETNGVQYVWLNYKALLDDMPILAMAKNNLYKRLQKMCDLEILKHTTLRNGGTYSYYAFGKRYCELIKSTPIENNQYPIENNQEPLLKIINTPIENNQEQNNPSTIYPSTKDNPSNISSLLSEAEALDCKQAIFELSLNDKSLYPIYDTDIDYYSNLYPNADVKQCFRGMIAWLDAHPAKRKTKRGIKAFINSWISKEQDRYKPSIEPAKSQIKYESNTDSFMRGLNECKIRLENEHG